MPKKKISKRRSITKHTSVADIIISNLPPIYKTRRRLSPKQQLTAVSDIRKHNKYHYLHNNLLSKPNKKLYNYVKKHKAVVSRKYNKDMLLFMKERGYPLIVRQHAKDYSIVGKQVAIQKGNVIKRFNRNNTKALVKGKWISKKKAFSLQKRAVKRARIKSYQDILGITKAKAKEVLKEIEKKTALSFELKALIY